MEEDFDAKKRGFTLSYCDNIEGETGRILAAETLVKAVSACDMRACMRARSFACVLFRTPAANRGQSPPFHTPHTTPKQK